MKYSGRNFDIVEIGVQIPEGQRTYEFAVTDDVVRVYPIDFTNDTIWLIEELRPGFSREWVLRPVSGSLNSWESVEDGAARELREELGISAKAYKIVHESQLSLKILCNTHHLVAEGLVHGVANPETGEIIKSAPHKLSSISDLVRTGRIVEDSAALALLKIADYVRAR